MALRGTHFAVPIGTGTARSRRHGESGASPERDAVKHDDVAATIFSLLGIDPHAQVRDRLNRPHPVSSGQVIEGVVA